jgi:hypothetical protein
MGPGEEHMARDHLSHPSGRTHGHGSSWINLETPTRCCVALQRVHAYLSHIISQQFDERGTCRVERARKTRCEKGSALRRQTRVYGT